MENAGHAKVRTDVVMETASHYMALCRGSVRPAPFNSTHIRTGIIPGKPHDNAPNVTERDSANKIDTMSPGSQTSCS